MAWAFIAVEAGVASKFLSDYNFTFDRLTQQKFQ